MSDVRRIGGGRGLRAGAGKRVMGCFLDDRSPGQGEIAQDGGTRGGTFRAEMDRCTAEKTRAELRHAVVCPNVTERTQERIA